MKLHPNPTRSTAGERSTDEARGSAKPGPRDQNYGEGKTRYREQRLHVVIPPVSTEAVGRLGRG
jgi:hypothetical protein